MKISPHWLRDFVDYKVDARQLAEDLTLAGIAVESVSGTGDATIYEMDITTNRVDAMNHYGIAREISAIYDIDLKPLEAKLPAPKGKANFPIEIEVPDLCTRFTGQVIRNVKIGPSPARVQQRFAQLEQKPINNAADATNYVLLEMGKPTHAFDLDKLEGGKLVIRMARAGETLKTLDGVERKLHREDVVVADAKKPVALAGVIGGWDTMITEQTKNILIESAWWDPAAIRRTSRRHAIHTDASHRFERGADWVSCPISTDLVSQMILESGGGELEGGKIDVIARDFKREPIDLHHAEVARILGKEIPSNEVERIMRRLGFTLTASRISPVATTVKTGTATAVIEAPADYTVELPTWRLDVEREIDLIEELARIHGFNKFANTLPGFTGAVVEPPEAEKKEKLRPTLLALGYNEAISSTFIAKSDSIAFTSNETAIVEIANPLSEEASEMRASLVPGMLDMIANNLNRGTDVSAIRLFESGHVHSMQTNGNADEHDALCIGATASAISSSADAAEKFLRFKGDIESLLESFQHDSLTFDTETPDYYHPGRSARAVMDGIIVARFGQLHPNVASARKLKQDVYVAEVMLDKLLQLPLRAARYTKLSRYPAVDRDFSFLLDDSITFDRITTAIRGFRLNELRRIEPAEIFRGGNVPAGKYSMLVRVTFQSTERTLRDDEVALWSTQITEALKALGGIQRA
ncbi:MAG: phenylalanyl-tRNA synthetase beta subunit [Acidobacteriaceae bacterium]|nr:phenylalanyl-tRNA synthetase beta subunit [Acidobacteriaceae bacterium]